MQSAVYLLDQDEKVSCELPGLWFSASELHALLTINELLAQLGSGLLAAELQPFRDRIEALLEANHIGGRELVRRVRVHGVGVRRCDQLNFRKTADALFKRLRMRIEYQDRQADSWTKRSISPQRLLYYRDNWYLESWCHLRDDLRLFALDRIRAIRLLDEPAHEVPERELDQRQGASYGIFSGGPTHTARLRFTPERARWVAEELYHPDQRGAFLADGSYELFLPYSDSRELLMDILRHGPDVEVLEPPELREEIRLRLGEAIKKYR